MILLIYLNLHLRFQPSLLEFLGHFALLFHCFPLQTSHRCLIYKILPLQRFQVRVSFFLPSPPHKMIVRLYSISHALRARSMSPFNPHALIDIQFNYVFNIYVSDIYIPSRRKGVEFERHSLCLFINR